MELACWSFVLIIRCVDVYVFVCLSVYMYVCIYVWISMYKLLESAFCFIYTVCMCVCMNFLSFLFFLAGPKELSSVSHWLQGVPGQ